MRRRRPALPPSHLEVEKEEEEEDAIRGQGEGRGLTAGGGGGGASQWRSLVRRPRCRNSHSTLIFSSNLFPRPFPTFSSSSEALALEAEANKMVVSTVPRFKKEASSLPSFLPFLEARPRPREGGLGLDRGGPGGAAAEGPAVRDKSKNEMAYFPLSPFFSLAFQVFQPFF